MTKLYNNILETVGNTPIVKINKMAPAHVNLYAKIEAFNPMGSVKDRLALNVIEQAEKSGALKPGQTIVEATSGNTGIGLAMVCAQKGYPLVITMVESFSVERRRLMRFLGAKVVLTPAALRGNGMVAKAKELADAHGWFMTRQFENEDNAAMHSRTTAPEILSAFSDRSLDYWVTGYGTGGTLKGVARVLRVESPNTKIVVSEPEQASLIRSGAIQKNNNDGSPAETHPNWEPHPIQGWTPDFIPKLTADAINDHYIDDVLTVTGTDAITCSKQLAQKEGVFVGISAGATMATALAVCKTAPEGSNILCMLPDTGERYLSTPLFGDIDAQMNDDERAVSLSTPSAQFSD
ncbi:cysteine synthase A [Arenicella chitinivorans]|uniref:Cysteine synthase B n=1 Tax=Arenicella chitinivorans TaxID=1329800 RepID=A0A918VJ61_9GAMM|nr:cysteine synthase A [Arenicella chitinivorans]GHA01559.1 cysteine synthase A [Arenicella chitinivorans]